jgi:hypothetical protein
LIGVLTVLLSHCLSWNSFPEIYAELLLHLPLSNGRSMQGETKIFYGIYLGDLSGRRSLGWHNLFVYFPLLTPFLSPKLEAFANRASQAPLLGLFGAFIHDWIPLIDEYYYCT